MASDYYVKNHCRETQHISSIFTSKQATAAAAIMFATNYRNPIGLQALQWRRRGKIRRRDGITSPIIPTLCITFVLLFLLGITVVPRETRGANKVCYGRCENGELEKTPRELGVEDK